MRFKRYCIRCGKKFQPKGKYTKICKDCHKPKGYLGIKNTKHL